MDYKAVGSQFCGFYYPTFASNRQALVNLYQADSMLSWENQDFKGAQSIMEKLTTLPFQQIQHQITSTDVQPGPDGASVLILVLGQLLPDGESKPLGFTQCFQLKAAGGSFYIFNEIFRLTLHNF
eukprot:comp24613_c0_seq1/m.46803 comp24613_c0_seq1/g.46803  ORF comp24613_c0_seq1/g.46803 comp24613_c0_seq1/m.46803 type:complete len:125 (-) comp24613_c0_seq1:223-597(-)